MRVSAIPYNFQSTNFEHVDKHYPNINYTQNEFYKFQKSHSMTGSDGKTYSSTDRAGEDIEVKGNIYSTDINTGLECIRVGTYEATGVVRIGPPLDGGDQTALKDVTIRNDQKFTSTWLSGVIGVMYKYSPQGSHGTVNSGRVNKIGLCYVNPANRKIVTYSAQHVVSGLPYGTEPEYDDKHYRSAAVLDTDGKNDVINGNFKYVGLVLEHFHRHTTGKVTLTCKFWHVRPIISYDKSAWNVTKDKFTVNGNASGKKILSTLR